MRFISGAMAWIVTLAMLLPFMAATAAAQPSTAALSAARVQELGERMYRQGILPSGKPMKAFVSGDVPADGTAFTCVSCHLRSGLGSVEGEVITPPTNGRILYQQRKPYVKGAVHVPAIHNYAVYLPERPAYTDETLASLLTTGLDPTGRSVLHVMPRYELSGDDLAILLAYLKQLSDKPSPGVGDRVISFATVIVEGSDPVAVDSMLLPIQFAVDRKNSLATASTANDRVARMGYNMLGDLHSYRFTLSRWLLKGAPETWGAQLEEYYRREPVFALLGGISPGTWEPVHRFCEEYRIPNLFPVVDDPVISGSDWYTQYLSRGNRQEGETAARYLNGMADLFKGKPVVQVVRDGRRGRALADGFRAAWQAAGREPAIDVMLPATEPLTLERLQQLTESHNPAVLVVWDDAAILEPLAALMARPRHPGMVITSGTWLGKQLWTVPESLRPSLYVTYPYRLPQDDKRFDAAAGKVMIGKRPERYDPVIVRQSFVTHEVLGKALMMMRGEYYRDFLFDVIGMMEDLYPPLYERLSFGPGQRYASKGCYIVQIGGGDAPQLEKRSEWFVQ